MDIIVTDDQMDRIIPKEDFEFVRRYRQIKKSYPSYRDLQQSEERVGDIYPEHSKRGIKLRTYVDDYLGKFLEYINIKLASETGDEYVGKKGRGKKVLLTRDEKQTLRSKLEILTYNVFEFEGVIDEIETDTRKFLKQCHKQPDFLWENRKLIIEVAGMEGDDYHQKLDSGSECLRNLGYDVIVIDARSFEKKGKFVEYYKFLCEKLKFKVRQDVLNNFATFMGHKHLTREWMQKYIDNNINSQPLTRGQEWRLTQYLDQLYGVGIKEYKKQRGLPRFKKSIPINTIRDFKSKNPNMSNNQIALHFGIHKNTVQTATKGMEGRKNQFNFSKNEY